MFNNRGEALDQYRSCIDPHSFLIPWEESSQSKQWTELARAQNKMEVSKRIIDSHESYGLVRIQIQIRRGMHKGAQNKEMKVIIFKNKGPFKAFQPKKPL
jgi:hypothetical protein